MARQERLAREDVLLLAERLLNDYGWRLHLTAYRTHTGSPNAHPWTGPIAWEARLTTTFKTSAELVALRNTLAEHGMDFCLRLFDICG